MEFLYRHGASLQPWLRLPTGTCRAKAGRATGPAWPADSASGKYVSSWTIRKADVADFHIEVPFECEVEIVLPEWETHRRWHRFL